MSIHDNPAEGVMFNCDDDDVAEADDEDENEDDFEDDESDACRCRSIWSRRGSELPSSNWICSSTPTSAWTGVFPNAA
jgi:hypothetical protein